MDVPVSPPYTQYEALSEDPMETEKTWLHRHGLASEHIDSLLSTCNRRNVGVCDDLVILKMLRTVVAKQPVVHNGEVVNLDHLRMELETSVEQKFAELRKAARCAEFDIYLAGANALPMDKSNRFLKFLRSDTLEARDTFIAEVLPWMVKALLEARTRSAVDKAITTIQPATTITKENATEKIRSRAPKRRQRSVKRIGQLKEPRRSERLAKRQQ